MKVLLLAATVLLSVAGCDSAPTSTDPWIPEQPSAAKSWDGGTYCAWGPFSVPCADLGDVD